MYDTVPAPVPVAPDVIRIHVGHAFSTSQTQPAGAFTVKLPVPPALVKLALAGVTEVTHGEPLDADPKTPSSAPADRTACKAAPVAAGPDGMSLHAASAPIPASVAPQTSARKCRRLPRPDARRPNADSVAEAIVPPT